MQSGCEGPGDEVEVKTSLLLSVTARYRLIPSVTVCYWDVAQVKTKGTTGREYLVKLTNVGPPDSAGRRQVTFHVNGERWYVYIEMCMHWHVCSRPARLLQVRHRHGPLDGVWVDGAREGAWRRRGGPGQNTHHKYE